MKELRRELDARVLKIIQLLEENTRNMNRPALLLIADEFGKDPFLILICCLLSLRAKDKAVMPVCRTLFSIARTPSQMMAIPTAELEKIIYPIGFYRNKARIIKSVSAELLKRFGGQVPASECDLLSIKGIGRKTANAVLGYAFDIPALCVDIHVHRIANRLGWMTTTTPEQTEAALKQLVPQQYWVGLNALFVMWGQNICIPTSPLCSRCAISHLCPKIGVVRNR